MNEAKSKNGKTNATTRIGLMACGSLMAIVLSKMIAHAKNRGDDDSHKALRAIGYKLEAVRARLAGDVATADILDLVARDAIGDCAIAASASVATNMVARGRTELS